MKWLRGLFTPSRAADFKASEPGAPKDLAGKMFDYIQAQKGIISLKELGTGNVFVFGTNRTITVYLVPIIDVNTRALFAKRGYSQAEVDEGIIILTERKPQRRYKNIFIDKIGKMHVVELKPDNSFGPAEVALEELEAVEKVAMLSAIPGRIIDQFGTSSVFQDKISTRDITDIIDILDLMSPSGLGIYNFGLSQHIEGVILMRKGQMHGGTSGLRAVSSGIKDKSAYFEDVIKKVMKAKQKVSRS